MSRIGERFRRLREERRKGFVGFVTAGDPSLERTVEVAGEMEKAGVDVLELGVPFSDPLADGPIIQRASERALSRGTTLIRVLEAVHRIRKTSDLPLLLYGVEETSSYVKNSDALKQATRSSVQTFDYAAFARGGQVLRETSATSTNGCAALDHTSARSYACR